MEVLSITPIFGVLNRKHMIDFKNKLGFHNYQGVLIEATGKSYKALKQEFSTFGEAVIAIKQARRSMVFSLLRSDFMFMDVNTNMFAIGIKMQLKEGVPVEKIAYDLYSQSLDNRPVMASIIGESLLTKIEKLCA